MNDTNDIAQVTVELNQVTDLSVPTGFTHGQLLDWLTLRVNNLLANNFNLLVNILYRMDVSEDKLRYYVQMHKNENAAGIIAQLMIERQLQKIESRRSFKRNDDIPDEEKW